MKSFQTCAVIIITGVSCHFLLAVVASYQSKETECIDSGLVLGDGTKIYSPQNCRPTECAATVSLNFLCCTFYSNSVCVCVCVCACDHSVL